MYEGVPPIWRGCAASTGCQLLTSGLTKASLKRRAHASSRRARRVGGSSLYVQHCVNAKPFFFLQGRRTGLRPKREACLRAAGAPGSGLRRRLSRRQKRKACLLPTGERAAAEPPPKKKGLHSAAPARPRRRRLLSKKTQHATHRYGCAPYTRTTEACRAARTASILACRSASEGSPATLWRSARR